MKISCAHVRIWGLKAKFCVHSSSLELSKYVPAGGGGVLNKVEFSLFSHIMVLSSWVSEWSCSVMSDTLQSHGHSPPGSSVCGIFQARILEWVALSFPRGSSQPRDWTQVSEPSFFTIWPTRETCTFLLTDIQAHTLCHLSPPSHNPTLPLCTWGNQTILGLGRMTG